MCQPTLLLRRFLSRNCQIIVYATVILLWLTVACLLCAQAFVTTRFLDGTSFWYLNTTEAAQPVLPVSLTVWASTDCSGEVEASLLLALNQSAAPPEPAYCSPDNYRVRHSVDGTCTWWSADAYDSQAQCAGQVVAQYRFGGCVSKPTDCLLGAEWSTGSGQHIRSATVGWEGDVYVYTPAHWTPLLIAIAAFAVLTVLAVVVFLGQWWLSDVVTSQEVARDDAFRTQRDEDVMMGRWEVDEKVGEVDEKFGEVDEKVGEVGARNWEEVTEGRAWKWEEVTEGRHTVSL